MEIDRGIHEQQHTPEHQGKDAGAFVIEQSATSEKGLNLVVVENISRIPLLNTIEELRADKFGPVKVSAGHRPRGKLNLQFVSGSDDTIYVNETAAIWEEYTTLADNPEVPTATGTAKVVVTTEKDGSDKILVQKRKAFRKFLDENGKQKQTGNELYGGIPGASVAGYWNAEWEVVDGNKVKVVNADTNAAINNIHQEMDHEIFLKPEDLILPGTDKPSTRIVGFVSDKIKPHTEIMLYAKTNLTAEEIKQRAKDSTKNRKKDYFDFEEDYFFIDATPEAIVTLLTDVKCPLPPTHAAAFEEAGYMMVLQTKGLEAAKAWQDMVIAKIKANYEAIDELVRNYYHNNPDVYARNKAEAMAKKRKLRDGYDSAFSPAQQGLPDVESEIERTKLESTS